MMTELRADALAHSWGLRYELGHPRPVVMFAIEPLAEICERRWRPNTDRSDHTAGALGKITAVVGCDRKTVHRWIAAGLTADAADKAAVALGLHPANVWGNAWWDAIKLDEDVA